MTQKNNRMCGQIVPLFAILTALFFAFLLMITSLLNKMTDSFLNQEQSVQRAMKNEFSDSNALNKIANINRKKFVIIQEIINELQSAITAGDGISGAALIWEHELPIPKPHNVLNSLDLLVAHYIPHLKDLSRQSKQAFQTLKPELQAMLVKLNFIQSACFSKCLSSKGKHIKSEACLLEPNFEDSCYLDPKFSGFNILQGSPPQLRELLTDELQGLDGYYIFRLDQFKVTPETIDFDSSNSTESRATVRVVHPRLCLEQYNLGDLPCIFKVKSNTSIPSAIHFEPHWSVSVEFP